ncbi:hypothetical protein QJS04_geneDACA024236 [Acorus gramineus]|uniref:Uncharacterized protein n=1 Tax=Acorus gramineus TaxID=55184 RepID=A0AAV8ZWV2_ACOGR|nr:hypothetical protein QJS04_geneDACA024236 [Acorus gramineus]
MSLSSEDWIDAVGGRRTLISPQSCDLLSRVRVVYLHISRQHLHSDHSWVEVDHPVLRQLAEIWSCGPKVNKIYISYDMAAADDPKTPINLGCQETYINELVQPFRHLGISCELRCFGNSKQAESMSNNPDTLHAHLMWATDRVIASATSRHSSMVYAPSPQHLSESSVYPTLLRSLRTFSERHSGIYVIRYLLENGVGVDDREEDHLPSALESASGCGCIEIVQVLLEHGADVNAFGTDAATALTQASYNGHHDVLQLLLKRGARVSAMNWGPNNPLVHASKMGFTEVVRLLIEGDPDAGKHLVESLTAASFYGHARIVELLLEQGADVNARDLAQQTALEQASRVGHCEVMRLLLNPKANVNTCTKDGQSALYYATSGGHHEATKLLLEHGVDINAKSPFKETALTVASGNGNMKLVRLLVSHGAAVKENAEVDIAFESALRHGHWEIARFLLDIAIDQDLSCSEAMRQSQAWRNWSWKSRWLYHARKFLQTFIEEKNDTITTSKLIEDFRPKKKSGDLIEVAV